MSSSTSRSKWYHWRPWGRKQDHSETTPHTSPADAPATAGGEGSNRDGVDVEDVVGQVKQAIVEANLSGGPGDDLVVTKVDLRLSVVRVRGGGIDAKWQVPVINKDVGGGWETKWTSANTVDVALKPPEIAGKAQALGESDIKSDLGRAIALVRAAVKAGAWGQPRFELGGATVELNFGVSNDGSVTFLAKGEASKTTTNILQIALGPRVSSRARTQSQSSVPNDGV
jgi:Trypsin-co-occurring domain 2